MGNFRYVKAVLWAFIGLGRRKDMAELKGTGNPLIMVAVAFALVALFLGTLAFIAHYAAS